MSGALQAVGMNLRSFITVPGAPTIGTATATGSSTATVAYTAPASNGGSVITSYTATSSPGGITGTLSQAGSGTITVTGLTGGTSYTFTVTATNVVGTGPASAASNQITTSADFMVQMNSAQGPTQTTATVDASGNIYISTAQNSVGTSIASYTPAGTLTYSKSKVTGNMDSRSSFYNGTNIYIGDTRDWTVLNTNGTVAANYRCAISGYTYISDANAKVIADATGNIYGAATWGNAADPDNIIYRGIVSKISSAGIAQWAVSMTASSATEVKGLYIDGSGNVFVSVVNYSSLNSSLSKLNSSGTIQTGTNNQIKATNTYAQGSGFDPVNSAHYMVGQTASNGAFLAKFDSAGEYVWMQGLYVGVAAIFYSLSFDSEGNIYVAGSSTPNTTNILAKYNSSGTLQWQRTLVTNTADALTARYSITVSGSQMIIAGAYNDGLNTVAFVLPTDGSKTGTLTAGSISAIYSTGSGSSSALSPTVDSLTPGLASYTLSVSTVSASLGTSTLTLTKANL